MPSSFNLVLRHKHHKHLNRKVKDKDFEDIDLRRVSGIVLGAEPIRPATLDKFATKFKIAGFNRYVAATIFLFCSKFARAASLTFRNAYLPCYGLAENCLVIPHTRTHTHAHEHIQIHTHTVRGRQEK